MISMGMVLNHNRNTDLHCTVKPAGGIVGGGLQVAMDWERCCSLVEIWLIICMLAFSMMPMKMN